MFRSTENRLLLIFGLLGILIRLLLLQQYAAQNPFYSHPVLDSALYLDWAQAIIENRSFFEQEYHHPPGYAFFLATILGHLGGTYYPVLFLQSLVLTIDAILVFYSAKIIFNKTSAWVAFTLFSLCGTVVFYSMKILTETFYTTLLLSSFFLLLQYSKNPGRWKILGCGLLLGAAIEFRPNGAICILPCLAAIFMNESVLRKRIISVMLLLVGIAVCILPILYRNVSVAGVWAPVSSNWGENFYFANNPSATGAFSRTSRIGITLESQIRDVQEEASRLAGRPLTSVEAQDFWFHQGLAFIRTQPGKWLRLELQKIQKLFSKHESSSIYFYDLETRHFQPVLQFFFVSYEMIVPLFFLGCLAIKKTPQTILLLGFIVSQVILLLIFWPELRFLVPVLPFLIIVASNVINIDPNFWRARGKLAFATSGLILWVVANLIRITGTGGREVWYANASSALFSQERYGRSAEFAKGAIALNPEYADAWVNLGAALHQSGKRSEARTAWNRALQINSNNFSALRNLALSYEQENPAKALQSWTLALKAARSEKLSADTIAAIEERITRIQKGNTE